MLTSEQIRNIRIFMQKATIVGAEVPAYVNVWQALDAMENNLGAADVPATDQPGSKEPPQE